MTDVPATGWGKWLGGHLLLIGSAVCFGMAIYLLSHDKSASAGVAGGLMILLLLIRILPDLESLKAFGIEAVLRKKVAEAEKTVEKLREMSEALGKFIYYQFGPGSRMMHPVRTKQELLDEIDRLLIAGGISKADHAAMKDKYLHFLQYDLNSVLQTIVERACRWQAGKLRKELSCLRREDVAAEEVGALEARIALVESHQKRDRYAFPDYGFLQWALDCVPRKGLLSSEDEKALHEFAGKIGKAGEDCRREGRIGDVGLELLEDHMGSNGTDALYRDLFKREPND